MFVPWGNKHFCIERGGQTFFVGGGGSYDDVDKEIDVSEVSFLVSKANIFVREVSKLSAGARIFILVTYNFPGKQWSRAI